ncbi:MAG: cobaltochelatase subunit CobN [Pseudomonadota bacterium]
MSGDLRLLFVTPGGSLEAVARVLPALAAEQGVEVQARSLLPQDSAEGRLPPSEARRLLSWADLVLYDVRDGGDLMELLRAEREASLDKCFVPLAGGPREALALCRMGSLDLSTLAQQAGPPVDLRRMQPISRIVEGLGTLVPIGALRDARNQLRIVRYWNAGGEANLRGLLRTLLREYGGGIGPAPTAPEERPPVRLEHPGTGAMFGSVEAWLAAHPPQPGLPWIGLLYDGGLKREASAAAALALTQALAGSANVLALASDGVHSTAGLRRVLDDPACPCLDALVSLLWHRLDGGPFGWDPAETFHTLERLDVPFLAPAALHGTDRARWEHGTFHPAPEELRAAVVGPEQDGALPAPPLLALEARESAGLKAARAVVLAERVQRLADQVRGWIRLRHTARRERRLAILIPGGPGGAAWVGLDPWLDVRASLRALCAALAEAGYDLGGEVPDPWSALDGGVRWLAEDYLLAWRELPPAFAAEVEQAFGPPPGAAGGQEAGLSLPGRWFGRLFLGVQPAGGDLPDHHTIALYRYLQEAGVHALIHLGGGAGPGAMRGKPWALSAGCTPDLLLGALPHVQVGCLASPAPLGQARRRARACCVTHPPPGLVEAGLGGELAELAELLEATCGRRAEGTDAAVARARALGLPMDDRVTLAQEIQQLATRPVSRGLHTLGDAPRCATLLQALRELARRPLAGITLADAARAQAGVEGQEALLDRWLRGLLADGRLPRDAARAIGRTAGLERRLADYGAALMEPGELAALLRVMDGRWLPPGPLGDPLRVPEALPAGRDGTLPTLAELPAPAAFDTGAALGAAVLAEHRQVSGIHLRTALLILRADEIARSAGEGFALALHLVGARALHRPGLPLAFEPIPTEELGRPRVDVALLIDGALRDQQPGLIAAWDRLVGRIALLDESAEANPVGPRGVADAKVLGAQLALARVFGPGPGAYEPDPIRAVRTCAARALGAVTHAMGFAWGEHLQGAAAAAAWERVHGRTELVLLPLDGRDRRLLDLDDGVSLLGSVVHAITRARGSAPRTVIADGAQRPPRTAGVAAEAARDTLLTLLHPGWLAALLRHPGHAAQQVAARVTRLVHLAATLDLPAALLDRASARLVEDEPTFALLQADHAPAAAELARCLVEAADRGLWHPTPERRSQIVKAADLA